MVRNLAHYLSVFAGFTPNVIGLLSPLLPEWTSSSPHFAFNIHVWQLLLHGVDAVLPLHGLTCHTLLPPPTPCKCLSHPS